MDDRRFRILVLGAGFSRPAGFPLGPELWRELLRRVRSEIGRDSHLDRDLSRFLEFKRLTTGTELTESHIDYEEFLSFLDIEHVLELRGSDTWSSEGNEGQLLVKGYIGKILNEHLQALRSLPACYLEFARRLRSGDIILTYNYDTLLELALDYAEVRYRLFPLRFKEIGITANTVDDSREEVAVLKLHGSVNWFDRSRYEESLAIATSHAERGLPYTPKHPVFGPDRLVTPEPIVDGPREANDPLSRLYRVWDPTPLYRQSYPIATPFILAPSYSKILYSDTLRAFWHGASRGGGMNLGMAIIGYSLPAHDYHAVQVIYALTRNYTESWWNEEMLGKRKLPLRVVDYRPDAEAKAALRNRYGFLNWSRTELHAAGFSSDAVTFLFSESPLTN